MRPTASATIGGDYCFRLYNATSVAALNTYTNYGAARVYGVTAIDLLSFVAVGEGGSVRVKWATAQEVENKGFRLYRAQSRGGPYIPLHEGLIPSASVRWGRPTLRVPGHHGRGRVPVLLQIGGRGC